MVLFFKLRTPISLVERWRAARPTIDEIKPPKNSQRHGGGPSLDHVDVVLRRLRCRRSLAVAIARRLGIPSTVATAEVILHLGVQLFLSLLRTSVSACTLSTISCSPTSAARAGTAPTLASTTATHWTGRAVVPSTGHVAINAFTGSLVLQVSVRRQRAVPSGWDGDALG